MLQGTSKLCGMMALAALGLLAGCASEAAAPGEGAAAEGEVGSAAQAVGVPTCVTVQRSPAGGVVEDAPIQLDPTDPTRANSNLGSVVQMNTGYSGTTYVRIVMKFDLSAVPANANVTSGTLSFRLIQSPLKAPVLLHAITAPWTESTVTYNVIGSSYLSTPEATIATAGVPSNTTLQADLTALVGRWVGGLQANDGILFDHPAAGRSLIASSEAPSLAPRPSLAVCYTVGTCLDGLQNQGEAGVDCGGPCAGCPHPPATEIVSAGETSTSPNYKAVYTIGQPSPQQDTAKSPSYRSQGGVIGANESLP